MRILAIRGENLASLSQPFELDFEREPLRSAGLFAVTGETGAGKSTILDTVCLALYDKFPRVDAAGESEDAPDPSGKALSASDPRAILRRGAGRGFAEVDFIARDGMRYRARCELYRARDKSSGALQPRRRSLWQIGDDGALVAAVDSGIEPVNRRIVELTDLSFDQFRRTALLAQGDFDAFLRAEPNERADLLEKITGAEIYGRLSRRAYEKDREAQQALFALEDRRRQIGVMGDDERLDKIEARTLLEAQRRALSVERDEISDTLRRFDALTQAQQRLERAEAAYVTARSDVLGVAPQRERLEQIARLESLRGPREAALAAEQSRDEAQRHFDLTAQRAAAAEQDFTRANAEEQATREALDALEREREGLSLLWRAAAALDARILSFAREEAAARKLAEDARQHAVQTREAHKARQNVRDRTAAALAQARLALEGLAAAQPLGERWAEIDELLQKHVELTDKARAAQHELRAACKDIDHVRATLLSFDAADASDAAALAALRAQISQRAETLQALGDSAARRDDAELAEAQAAASDLSRLCAEHRDAVALVARAQEEDAAFSKQLADLSARGAALQEKREAERAEVEDASRLGDLADAAAEPHALHLRAKLLDDTECPVCGAREHPFAKAGQAANKLVAALRARRDKARRRLAATEEKLIAARGDAARAEARQKAAQSAHDEAQRIMTRTAERYASESSRLAAAPQDISLAAAPLAQLLAELVAARAALAEKFETARKLREELDRLRHEEEKKRLALDARRAERDAFNLRAQQAGEMAARLETRVAAMNERTGSLARSLAPYLGSCDLSSDDLLRDPGGVRARLERLGAQWRQAVADVTQHDTMLRTLEPEVAHLSALLQGADAAQTVAYAALAERQRLLEETRAERAGLLGGEETEAHRARFGVLYEAAAQAREAARLNLTTATSGKATSAANLAHAAADRDETMARAVEAKDLYALALEASGHDEAQVNALLAIGEEERGLLRRAVEACDAQLAAAQSALVQRQTDLVEASAAAPQDVPREEFEARAALLAGEIDALSVQLGALTEQLAQDGRARDAAAALTHEIDAARAQRKIWAEINEAIGSREGDKFRRFAQAVTLEELVALANRRLSLLTPRYALERSRDAGSLGLQIVDRDLGDERRSTRSLSGGERFLASLALALALAGLEGRDSFVDTLFIDEGFGALDSSTLDVAIDALETLQAQGRRVGVISHVESMQQRIATKICVERRGGGASVVRICAPGYD